MKRYITGSLLLVTLAVLATVLAATTPPTRVMAQDHKEYALSSTVSAPAGTIRVGKQDPSTVADLEQVMANANAAYATQNINLHVIASEDEQKVTVLKAVHYGCEIYVARAYGTIGIATGRGCH